MYSKIVFIVLFKMNLNYFNSYKIGIGFVNIYISGMVEKGSFYS